MPPPGRIAGGSIFFEGRISARCRGSATPPARRPHRDDLSGSDRDPQPGDAIGAQIAELFQWHRPAMTTREIRRAATTLLERVGIPDPERRRRNYPHELSGGMRQRVVIACALALDPALIVADEPTTALDVTVQAQIFGLMRALRAEHRTAVIFISHDLGVIAEMCDRVIVMYAGSIMESGPIDKVLGRPRHPYRSGFWRRARGLIIPNSRSGRSLAACPISSVVVGINEPAIAVTQLQRWICQRSSHRQRWTNRPHDDPHRVLPQHNQSADQDVVSRLDQPARGNVRQLGIDRPVQIVRFHHSDAGPVVHSAHDGGVSGIVGRQDRHDGRFQIVARRNGSRNDLRLLIAPPVVVGSNQSAGGIA